MGLGRATPTMFILLIVALSGGSCRHPGSTKCFWPWMDNLGTSAIRGIGQFIPWWHGLGAVNFYGPFGPRTLLKKRNNNKRIYNGRKLLQALSAFLTSEVGSGMLGVYDSGVCYNNLDRIYTHDRTIQFLMPINMQNELSCSWSVCQLGRSN